jgi:hypothetical protein
MAKYVIGCKLPHGIIIELPADPSKKITLNGKNKAVIIGAEHGTTDVDSEFWDAWIAANPDFPAVKSGAIFVAKNLNDAAAIAKETADEKTGFEAMDPKSNGVKPAKED